MSLKYLTRAILDSLLLRTIHQEISLKRCMSGQCLSVEVQFLQPVLVADVLISSFKHQSVSVTDTLRAASLIGRRGVSLASVVEACVTVCTTPKGRSVRDARRASTETPRDRTLPPTPANVRYTHTDTQAHTHAHTHTQVSS